MGTLFRSEEMSLVQLLLNGQSSYLSIAELGELGCLQFRDLNLNTNSFEKKFIPDVRRCEEMERKLRYFKDQLFKSGISTFDTSASGEFPDAPLPKELALLEENLSNIDSELKDVLDNEEKLKENFLELLEIKNVLRNADLFFSQVYGHRFNLESSSLTDFQDANERVKLNYISGTIANDRVNIFEKILFRATHGTTFVKIFPILSSEFTNPKSVFVICFQGTRLDSKIRKIAEGLRAKVFPVPESSEERRESECNVSKKIEDISNVIYQTNEHKMKILNSCSKKVNAWYAKVMKAKAIYHIHNFLSISSGSTLVGEAWCPSSELDAINTALRRGTERSGSTIPSVCQVIKTDKPPPTYFRTNQYTEGFQNLVNAYGFCDYKEINPAPFTIITFPFLFGVMFGDIGHGIIMTILAWILIVKERSFKRADYGDIFDIMFGGRYIIFLMGIFSIYCGFIYNDAFSKSINIFGSGWKANTNSSVLSPITDFKGPYFYGVDPIWQISENKIVWLNSFKMKASVVIGITQMFFGLVLKFQNSIYFRKRINIIGEFIPEMIFFCSIFGYLVLTIIWKYLAWDAEDSACAPSLLINLINIFIRQRDLETFEGQKRKKHQKRIRKFLF